MDISLADERALVIKEQLSLEQAEGRAWSKKIDAFDCMVKMASFLQRLRGLLFRNQNPITV